MIAYLEKKQLRILCYVQFLEYSNWNEWSSIDNAIIIDIFFDIFFVKITLFVYSITCQFGAGVPGLLEPGFELSATEWLPWFVKAIGLTVASMGSHWKYRSENS